MRCTRISCAARQAVSRIVQVSLILSLLMHMIGTSAV